MSGHTRPKLLPIICILAAALTASRAGAESAEADGACTTGCCTEPTPAKAGGARVSQTTGESLQHKSWQPTGGEIEFTVKSFDQIPSEASVFLCFRWKTNSMKSIQENPYREAPSSRLELNGDRKRLKVTTTVPDLKGPPDDIATAVPYLDVVPLAEVRILAIDNEKKTTAADVTTAIGITHPWLAFAFAIATVVLGFVVLHIAAGLRLKHHRGIMKANWLLRIISTPSGFASLSQLQIILWTFVVAASAVYVMSLSGQLIQVTNGTLVLLGIAGAAGIGAKAHFEARGATAETAAATAAADKETADIDAAKKAAAAVAPQVNPVEVARITLEKEQAQKKATAKDKIATQTRARADALKHPPHDQIPRWSDLIVNESVIVSESVIANESVKDGVTKTREIDVARFQMLLFTLITAVFVLMNVVTSYVIPEISPEFLTLMGISNGVYMGSKITQSS